MGCTFSFWEKGTMQREIAVEKAKEAQGCNFKFKSRETEGFTCKNCGRKGETNCTTDIMYLWYRAETEPSLSVLWLGCQIPEAKNWKVTESEGGLGLTQGLNLYNWDGANNACHFSFCLPVKGWQSGTRSPAVAIVGASSMWRKLQFGKFPPGLH